MELTRHPRVGRKGDLAGASREARKQGHAGREARGQGHQRHVTTRRRGAGGTRRRDAQRITAYPLSM